MSVFTDSELAFLLEKRRLGRIATVGPDGTPHVVPVGWSYNAREDALDVGGIELEQTKKYRDVQRTGRAAIVVDEITSVTPWRVRGVEVRGRAQALDGLIRIRPTRIVSWGIEADDLSVRRGRTVA